MKVWKSNLQMIRLTWQGSRAWVICQMLNMIINPLRNLTIDVLLIGHIYNAIQKGKEFQELMPLFVGLVLFYAANLIFEAILFGRVSPIGGLKIDQYIDRKICEAAAKVPLSSYDNADFFEKYIFAAKNCSDTAKKAVQNMAYFIAFSLGGIMGIGLIAGIDPEMTVFIIVSVVISFALSSLKQKLDFRYQDKISKVRVKEEFIHRVFYMKEYAKELRSIKKLPDFLLGMFAEIETDNQKITKEYGKKSLFLSVLANLNTRTLMYWTTMLLTVFLIRSRGTVEPGNLLIMTTSIGTAALLIQAIVNTIPEMNQIMLFHQNMDTFLKAAEEKKIEGKKIIQEIESIRFSHVSFTYPNEERAVLEDVSFEVRKNEKLAIVGVNGAGKTTLMKLLLKFYVPDSGNIYVNEIDIREIDEQSYREAFGCVFQDVNLFAMPVYQNIVLGDQLDDWETLKEVLEKSGLSGQFPTEEACHAEITKELSEDGITLSGGNAQRVAIARALYQNTSVLLLDEATSAVDVETEQAIMDSVDKASQDKITFLISHKLSCVRKADRILFLEEGRIAESGNHQELTERKGKYYELFKKQADQFEKAVVEQTLEREEWL